MLLLRPPAVAGRFYPGDPEALRAAVAELVGGPRTPVPALALLAPHAGYIYSGALAGLTWASVDVPERVILLCPNHTGEGARRSIWPDGHWSFPGGKLEVDAELAARLADRCGLTPDTDAHRREHAIEVHLPFVHARRPGAKIVPICLAGLSLDECRAIGQGIAATLPDFGGRTLIAASSDMSHYIAATEARTLDGMALERFLALDPAGLYRVVRARQITMCGVIPATIALHAAIAQGADATRLIGYTNSGEQSGDFAHVVGYAGAIVHRRVDLPERHG